MTTLAAISARITAKTRGGVVMAGVETIVKASMHHTCQCQHQCLMAGCGAADGCVERATK
jgi:hypothetical protein